MTKDDDGVWIEPGYRGGGSYSRDEDSDSRPTHKDYLKENEQIKKNLENMLGSEDGLKNLLEDLLKRKWLWSSGSRGVSQYSISLSLLKEKPKREIAETFLDLHSRIRTEEITPSDVKWGCPRGGMIFYVGLRELVIDSFDDFPEEERALKLAEVLDGPLPQFRFLALEKLASLGDTRVGGRLLDLYSKGRIYGSNHDHMDSDIEYRAFKKALTKCASRDMLEALLKEWDKSPGNDILSSVLGAVGDSQTALKIIKSEYEYNLDLIEAINNIAKREGMRDALEFILRTSEQIDVANLKKGDENYKFVLASTNYFSYFLCSSWDGDIYNFHRIPDDRYDRVVEYLHKLTKHLDTDLSLNAAFTLKKIGAYNKAKEVFKKTYREHSDEKIRKEAGRGLGYSPLRIWAHEHEVLSTIAGACAASGLGYMLYQYMAR